MARGRTVTLEIENLDEFIADLNRIGSQAQRGAEVGLRDEAKAMLARSQILVPVKTGALAGSGFVGLVTRWARGWEIRFGYGSPYALYQHFGHYEHDDGQRLFLERPVKYAARQFYDRMRVIWARYLR